MKAKVKNRYRVNWVDGMKINKDHFIAMEHSALELLSKADQRNVSPLNYGLLPPWPDQESALDVMISVDGQSTIHVVLNTCRAITLGGHSIDITQDTNTLLEQSGTILKQQYSIGKDENEWYVILRVDPFKRVAVGHSDPEEEPPRRPYVFPKYTLDIRPKNELADPGAGPYHIPIGKVFMEGGKTTVAADYIPPCRSVQSHPELKYSYHELGAFLNQMESFSLHIIQKIHQKKQTNDLANIALYLSEQVMRYVNENMAEFRCIDKHEPPIRMISKLVNLSRVIKASLDVFIGTGKEDFFNYLTELCHLDQGSFENVMVETIELEYVHNDINSALTKVSSFTKLMLSLFKKLSELDYIGKKADSSIFVKEEIVDPSEGKGRRSILHD